MLSLLSSILPPDEIDVLGILVKRMGEALKRHVEGSIPGHNLGSGGAEERSEFSELSLRALPHIGRLVKLPQL